MAVQTIESVARASGLILDPVYTGKAFRALLCEPERFGPRPLFVHTGDIFGLLSERGSASDRPGR